MKYNHSTPRKDEIHSLIISNTEEHKIIRNQIHALEVTNNKEHNILLEKIHILEVNNNKDHTVIIEKMHDIKDQLTQKMDCQFKWTLSFFIGLTSILLGMFYFFMNK
jgi:hypothetical protein